MYLLLTKLFITCIHSTYNLEMAITCCCNSFKHYFFSKEYTEHKQSGVCIGFTLRLFSRKTLSYEMYLDFHRTNASNFHSLSYAQANIRIEQEGTIGCQFLLQKGEKVYTIDLAKMHLKNCRAMHLKSCRAMHSADDIVHASIIYKKKFIWKAYKNLTLILI